MTVMKHHYFFNFTEYGMEAPTWINVMREPISWFESRYWFKQNGWIHKVVYISSKLIFLCFIKKT